MENDQLPVFKSGLQSGLSTIMILNTIKKLNTNDERVAKVVPNSISHNVAFVVDITSPCVGHVKNFFPTIWERGHKLVPKLVIINGQVEGLKQYQTFGMTRSLMPQNVTTAIVARATCQRLSVT